jgi:hypothetical protein
MVKALELMGLKCCLESTCRRAQRFLISFSLWIRGEPHCASHLRMEALVEVVIQEASISLKR